MRRFFLIAFLFLQCGCPVTCFFTPIGDDYLTMDNSVRISGILLGGDEEGTITDWEPISGLGMPCRYSFYGSNNRENNPNIEFDVPDDVVSHDCFTTSDAGGIFLLDLVDLGNDEDTGVRAGILRNSGLYTFEFLSPILQPRGLQLITVRSNLEPKDTRYYYIDWETDEAVVDSAIADALLESLSIDSLEGFQLDELADLVKIEIERVIESEFDWLRIYQSEELRSPMIKVSMTSCPSEAILCENPSYRGVTIGDYHSYDSPDGDVDAIINFARTYEYVDSSMEFEVLHPDDSPLVRVVDFGYAGAVTPLHEMGHALGLVDMRLYGTSTSHPPETPDFLVARRRYGSVLTSINVMTFGFPNEIALDYGQCEIYYVEVPNPERPASELGTFERCLKIRYSPFDRQFLAITR